jgi:hypothetical protein
MSVAVTVFFLQWLEVVKLLGVQIRSGRRPLGGRRSFVTSHDCGLPRNERGEGAAEPEGSTREKSGRGAWAGEANGSKQEFNRCPPRE